MLMLWTGQRVSDIVRLGWPHLRQDRLAVRQEKTDAGLLLPVAAELADALARVPQTSLTFLLAERGAPFTAKSSGQWFRARCDEAGLPQYSAHGLRKLCATRLAELGCSDREIMAITGHKSVSEVSRYTKAAEQAKMAESAIRKMSAGRTEGHKNLSNLGDGLDKSTSKPLIRKS